MLPEGIIGDEMDKTKVMERSTHSFWILPLIRAYFDIDKDVAITEAAKSLMLFTLRRYINDLERDDFLGFKSDRIFYRATFAGVSYEKINPTCELAIVVKNLDKYARKLYRAKNTQELQKHIKGLNTFFEPLNEFFEKQIVPRKEYNKISKSELLYAQALFEFFIMILQDNDGYFARKGLEKDYIKFLEVFLGKLAQESELISEVLKGKEIQRIAFDNPYRHKVLDALIKKTFDSWYYFDFFEKKEELDKSKFNAILNTVSRPKLSDVEKLREHLLWYKTEILDSRKDIFAGWPVFESLIHGEVLKRRQEKASKLQVIEFVYQDDPAKFRSFAVLIEAYGSFSDMSGWLIFKGLGGDYAGLGGTHFHLAKTLLEHYKHYIDLKQVNVHEALFESFLQVKHFDEDSFDFDEEDVEAQSQSEQVKNLCKEYGDKLSHYKKFASEALAQLLELLVYSYFVKKFGAENVKWSFQPDKKSPEIDVVAKDETNKKLFLVECSLQLDPPKEEIGKFIKKAEKLKTIDEFKELSIEQWLVTTKKAFSSPDIEQFKTGYSKGNVAVIEFEDNLLNEFKRVFPEVSTDKLSKMTKLFELHAKKPGLIQSPK